MRDMLLWGRVVQRGNEDMSRVLALQSVKRLLTVGGDTSDDSYSQTVFIMRCRWRRGEHPSEVLLSS